MSDTPRTDEAFDLSGIDDHGLLYVEALFARQLERELNDATRKIEAFLKYEKEMKQKYAEEIDFWKRKYLRHR